jgi:hypothetical protein
MNMQRFWRRFSGLIFILGIFGAAMMLLPALLTSSKPQLRDLIGLLPAGILFVLLGTTAAGVLRLLLSIDERLEALLQQGEVRKH